MKLSIPPIKLPKLPKPKITGSFSLSPPRTPTISWNALGGVFNKPTLFNTANAGLQGVGEAGAEAILPLNASTYGGIANGIVKAFGGSFNQQPVAEGDDSIEINFNIEKMVANEQSARELSKMVMSEVMSTMKRTKGGR